jgi:hypothetical protein
MHPQDVPDLGEHRAAARTAEAIDRPRAGSFVAGSFVAGSFIAGPAHIADPACLANRAHVAALAAPDRTVQSGATTSVTTVFRHLHAARLAPCVPRRGRESSPQFAYIAASIAIAFCDRDRAQVRNRSK